MSGVKPKDLIHEIKIRPGIYNRDVLEHPRREHKHQLWLEVAERLTPAEDWESYTDVEKEARMDEIAGKWKHIRANFYREIKLIEAGEANKKRKYLYFDDMEFMRPFVGYKLPPMKRDKKSNDSLDDIEEFENNDSDMDLETLLKTTTKEHDDEEEELQQEEDVEELNTSVGTRTRSKRIIKPTLKAKQNKPTTTATTSSPVGGKRVQKESIIKNFDVLKKSNVSASNPSFKIRDGDISFCLSLVPTLRKLGDSRKLRAKIEILKVLHRYVEHIEKRNLINRSNANSSNHNNSSKNPADLIEEMADDDHSDHEYGESSVNVKRERGDPLNGGENAGGGGNTKTWWT
ncbi:uncharacterized protein LOC111678704 [Lucilia cuprina]|uniref:uncharacterized protein LOC111678704 n=1 Tax=Lucilia cuprina TaxID=7375 RepID=UPI001F053070|nr:uncharacterized protein LOC111678704 [Lucilia cuprina]